MDKGIETMRLIIDAMAEERARVSRVALRFHERDHHWRTGYEEEVYKRALRDFSQALATNEV